MSKASKDKVTEAKTPTPTPTQTRLHFFVAVSPGLESLLSDELAHLGLAPKVMAGGVEVNASFVDMMRVCVQSRLAESVRVRLKSFTAAHFDVLKEQLQRLPWHAYLRRELPTHVTATCKKSRLYHSNAVIERVQQSIDQCLKGPLAYTTRADARQTVHVRIDRDEVETSIDASGELLHRRGYRTHVSEAPLRETLAAALVQCAKTDSPATTMWDPFCGSGTIALEWLAAQQTFTQAQRGFAFEQWPTFKAHASALQSLLASQAAYVAGTHRAFGSDISEKALAATRHNAAQLGVAEDITLHAGDFADAASSVPKGSVVITNPPYGKRIGDNRAVLTLHRRFEQLLQARTDLRPVVMACGFAPFLGAMTLPWTRVLTTKNGGLPITVLRLD